MDLFNSHQLTTLLLAFFSGFLPTMVWLYFWLRETRDNPEPPIMVAVAFIGGSIGVFISLFLEKFAFSDITKIIVSSSFLQPIKIFFDNIATLKNIAFDRLLLVTVYAPVIEETTKFVIAYFLVLRSKEDNRPIDPIIYMIATALGFSAIENTLFLINPFSNHDVTLSIFTGNMRFVGATLLHTICSATIAMFIGFNFFDSWIKKTFFIFIGVLSAIVIHGVFNYFMVGDSQSSIIALELIWVSVIIILLAFEKIKKIRQEKIC